MGRGLRRYQRIQNLKLVLISVRVFYAAGFTFRTVRQVGAFLRLCGVTGAELSSI